MKKSLALVLALIMVLSSFSFVSAAPDFADVKGTEYEEAVARLELLNVLKGYPDGTFKPANTITRAEFAAVAVRVKGLAAVAEAAKGLPSGFSDVPAGHWAAGYVGVAGSTGIVNGIGGGLFAPNAPVKYEEAVTMLVRALGYEVDAQTKGGYPFGYLIVAKEIELLDDVVGTMGLPASRGMVAVLTDNALEIPMMVQVGFGTDIKWVVSGSTEHGGKAVHLLDFMGFAPITGRVTAYDPDDLEITVGGKTYDVKEGFDFYKVMGVELKMWVDGNDVIAYTMEEDVLFDAVVADKDAKAKRVKLAGLDKEYNVVSGAAITVNEATDSEDFTADYAKIVLNSRNEIVWAEGYTFNGYFVVDMVDGDELVDLNDEDIDVEDYLIVKDGKTISIDDIEKGDVFFYNSSKEFGVVYNNIKTGVITRTYANLDLRLDGTLYEEIANDVASFVDGKVLGDITKTELDKFEDEGEKVDLFLDFYGDYVLIVGTRGEAATTKLGAIATKEANMWLSARSDTYYYAWELVNELGEEVSLDEKTTSGAIDPAALAWAVVEYEVEEDGDLVDVVPLTSVTTGSAVVKVDARYAAGKRLQSDTVVFLIDKTDKEVDAVFTWADADEYFGEMTEYAVYYTGGDADYIVVSKSDAGGEFKTKQAVLMSSKELAGGKFEVKFNVEGTTVEVIWDNAVTTPGAVYNIDVNEALDDIKTIGSVVTTAAVKLDVETINERLDTFNTTPAAVTAFNARYAKVFKVEGTKVTAIDFDDVNEITSIANKDVYLYMDGTSTVYVKYMVVKVN